MLAARNLQVTSALPIPKDGAPEQPEGSAALVHMHALLHSSREKQELSSCDSWLL